MAYNSNFNVIRAQSVEEYGEEKASKKFLFCGIFFFIFGFILILTSFIIKRNAKSELEASKSAVSAATHSTTTYVYTKPETVTTVSIVEPVEKPNPYTTELKSDFNCEEVSRDSIYLTELKPVYSFYSETNFCLGNKKDNWKNSFPNTLQSSYGFADDRYNLYDVCNFNTLTFFLTYWDSLEEGSIGKVRIYGGETVDNVKTLLFSEEVSAGLREPKQITIDISEIEYIKIQIKGEENLGGDSFIAMMGSPMLLK